MVTAAMKLKDTPWEKSYDQHAILKSRDVTLPTKVNLVKTITFPVVMHEYDICTIKKAEC